MRRHRDMTVADPLWLDARRAARQHRRRGEGEQALDMAHVDPAP